MDKEKIKYFRERWELPASVSDAEIANGLQNSLTSELYDLGVAMRNLWDAVEQTFPRFFAWLRG